MEMEHKIYKIKLCQTTRIRVDGSKGRRWFVTIPRNVTRHTCFNSGCLVSIQIEGNKLIVKETNAYPSLKIWSTSGYDQNRLTFPPHIIKELKLDKIKNLFLKATNCHF